jgi:hypothetical protein
MEGIMVTAKKVNTARYNPTYLEYPVYNVHMIPKVIKKSISISIIYYDNILWLNQARD